MTKKVCDDLVPRITVYRITRGDAPELFLKTSLFVPLHCSKQEGRAHNIPEDVEHSYDVFRLFFTDEALEIIATATNQNAERKRVKVILDKKLAP